MSHRGRLVLFALGAAGLAATLGAGFAGMPSFGGPISAYAALLNHLAPLQRRVTDVVSAVTFDYRGIDTLFEEFILFSAVSGIAVLLRPLADEVRGRPEDTSPERRIPPPSPAVGLLGVVLCPLLVVVGVETVTHGQLSPGGGFQGGVVLASALFVVYLATDYATVERYQPKALLDASEGAGAGGYVVIGAVGLLAGGAYLTNVVSLGRSGNLISGGTIALLNIVVGVEVAAGFALLAAQFLDQTSVIRPGARRPPPLGESPGR
ncbi:MAG: MnhB domain-containing protein [Acidimicrobiales bacterium]